MEAVLVAVIAAVGTILAALVQSMRKENRDDHAIVADSLDRIETKLDKHIDDHLKGNLD
jgi:Na+-translocating ferredoxin:NAD+ oxidoreductase RnfG subunit